MTTIVYVAAFFVVALLVYMARYSGQLRVAQTRVIDAPLAAVYAQVADLRHWPAWNPWLEHEPDAPATLSDPAAAEGSVYAWDTARIGCGRIEHVRLIAPAVIEQRMRFRKPFPFRGRGRWQFTNLHGKTEVRWSMKGRVGFAMRAFAQTVQGTVALDFRYGLDRLARLLEGSTAPGYTLVYLGLRDIPAVRYAYLTHEGPLDGLAAAMRAGFAELRQRLAHQGVPATAPPLAIYVKTHIKQRRTVCHLGIPVSDAGAGDLPLRELPAHRAYVTRLQGDPAALEVAWYQAMQRMRVENIEPDLRITPFERHLDDPDPARGDGPVTELHIPVREKAPPAAPSAAEQNSGPG